MTEQQANLEVVAAEDESSASGSVLIVEGSLAARYVELTETEEDDNEADERGRRKRRTRSRARTISIRRLSKTELAKGRAEYPEDDYWRPKLRGDCAEMERPCPFVACKYHLYIDVHPVRGSIKINFPDVEVWEMTDTCALDIADRGGITLEEVGQIMNLTRERVRQLETQGLAKLQDIDGVDRLRDYVAF